MSSEERVAAARSGFCDGAHSYAPEGPSLGNRIVSGVVWTAIETWGQQLAMFTVFVMLARLLGPEAIGLAVLAIMVPLVLAVPVNKGIPDAIVQRAAIEPKHLDSAFWLLFACGAGLSLAAWLLAWPIALAFRQPLLVELIHWTSITVVLQSLASVPAAVLKRRLDFRMLAIRTLVGTVLGGAVGVAMALKGYGVWSLIGLQLVKVGAETLVLHLCSDWHPRWGYSHAHCRSLFGFAFPVMGSSLWSLINDEMPKTMLGAFLGPTAVGIYALARRPLELLTNVLVNPLSGVTMASVARMQADPEGVDRFYDRSVRIVALVGFPAFMGLAAIAPEAVPMVLGQEWSASVPAVQIIMLLGLVRIIDSICACTALGFGHSRLILILNVAYTALLGVMLVTAAHISLEATMLAIVLANALLLPVLLYYTRRLARVDVLKPLASFPILALCTAIMLGAVTGWRELMAGSLPLWALVISAIAVGVSVYTVAAIALMRRELDDARNVVARMSL